MVVGDFNDPNWKITEINKKTFVLCGAEKLFDVFWLVDI